MNYFNRITALTPSEGDPLSLSERLIILALDADRAGFSVATEHLLQYLLLFADYFDTMLLLPHRNPKAVWGKM